MCLQVADLRNRPQQYNTARPHFATAPSFVELPGSIWELSTWQAASSCAVQTAKSLAAGSLDAEVASQGGSFFTVSERSVWALSHCFYQRTSYHNASCCVFSLQRKSSRGGREKIGLTHGPFAQHAVVSCMQFASWLGALSMDTLVSTVRK